MTRQTGKPHRGLIRWWLLVLLYCALIVLVSWRTWRGWCLAALGLIGPPIGPCMGVIVAPPGPPKLTASSITQVKRSAGCVVLHAVAATDSTYGWRCTSIPVLAVDYGEAWEFLPLYDDGTHGDSAAGDGSWELDWAWDPRGSPLGAERVLVLIIPEEDYRFSAGASVELEEVQSGTASQSESEETAKAAQ